MTSHLAPLRPGPVVLGHWLLARLLVALHGVRGPILEPAVNVANGLAEVVLAEDQPMLDSSVAVLVALTNIGKEVWPL